jgi:hypothetical protein
VCNKFKSEIVHDKICLKLCPMVVTSKVVSDNQCNTGVKSA